MANAANRPAERRPRPLAWLAPLALAAAAHSPAPAQVGAGGGGADGGDEIIVTGYRDREQAIRHYVETVTVESDRQIARFATPICPASFGLPDHYAEVISGRIRQIAAYLEIGVLEEGCAPNVLIVFADRGGELLNRLRDDRPALFSALQLADIRRLMRAPGPVRAWQIVEPHGADGRPMERISWLEGSPPRYVPRGYQLTGVMPSRTQQATRQDLALSFIVLDLDAVEGLTLLQLADYAAMRALARTEAASAPNRQTILSLFEDKAAGTAPAGELTSWDAAYLRALYRTGNAVTAHQQRSSMARTMARELDSATASSRRR